MATLLTYDIKTTSSTIHTELKKRLIDHYAYSERIQGNNGLWYNLPNTTLRKQTGHQQAAADFLQACKDVGATWERYITSEYANATFSNQ